MYKLSIVTICKNAADSIEKTIESVINQSYKNYQYIIIDGGSSDGTVNIVKNYIGNINQFISEPDTGIYNAQNKGIAQCEGEYIYFLNAGDYILNTQTLEKIFSFNLSADIIYGDIIVKMKKGLVFKKKLPARLSKIYMMNDTLPHQASFIRRKLFDKIGLYDESYILAADYDFFLKAIYGNGASLQYISVPFSVYNLEGQSSGLVSRRILNAERLRAQKNDISQYSLMFQRIIQPFYQLFVKYPRFLYFIIKDRIYNDFNEISQNNNNRSGI